MAYEWMMTLKNNAAFLSFSGVLAAAGVELQSFSASTASSGEQWYCMGISSLLGDIGALKSLAKEAAQLTVWISVIDADGKH